MRKWVKWTLIGVITAVLGFMVFAGVGTYYVLRHLETGHAAEADTLKKFDAIKARYGDRKPLVEIADPQAADVRLNRAVHPEGKRAAVLHVLNWNAEKGERMEADLPLWLMRFSTLNVLSRLGVAPARFRLTAQDVIDYGPGIVVDYRRPGKFHVLIWVE